METLAGRSKNSSGQKTKKKSRDVLGQNRRGNCPGLNTGKNENQHAPLLKPRGEKDLTRNGHLGAQRGRKHVQWIFILTYGWGDRGVIKTRRGAVRSRENREGFGSPQKQDTPGKRAVS